MRSSGILLYKLHQKKLQVLLVHPGGPFWKNKDDGAWTIPKGEINENEDPLAAATREFEEETGTTLKGPFTALTQVRQKAGKIILAWASEGDLDIAGIKSNNFEMEWPPHSGRRQTFPEIDRAEWFTMAMATKKINPAQVALLEELMKLRHQV